MGYLICEKCGGYYELQPGEHPEDFDRCNCGGQLVYSKYTNYISDDSQEVQNISEKEEYVEDSSSHSYGLIISIVTSIIVLYGIFHPQLSISNNFNINPQSFFIILLVIGGLILLYRKNSIHGEPDKNMQEEYYYDEQSDYEEYNQPTSSVNSWILYRFLPFLLLILLIIKFIFI